MHEVTLLSLQLLFVTLFWNANMKISSPGVSIFQNTSCTFFSVKTEILHEEHLNGYKFI